MAAAYYGHHSIVKRLLVAGASPGIKAKVSNEIAIPSSYVCVVLVLVYTSVLICLLLIVLLF